MSVMKRHICSQTLSLSVLTHAVIFVLLPALLLVNLLRRGCCMPVSEVNGSSSLLALRVLA